MPIVVIEGEPVSLGQRWRKIVGVVLAVTGLCLYLFFSSPGEVVVDADGNITGLTNAFRASLQGKRFWATQLQEITTELAWQRGEPQRRLELDALMAESAREADAFMEQAYRNFPQTRPSEAERRAQALREEADRLEDQEFSRMVEEYRLGFIAELEALLPTVRAKAE